MLTSVHDFHFATTGDDVRWQAGGRSIAADYGGGITGRRASRRNQLLRKPKIRCAAAQNARIGSFFPADFAEAITPAQIRVANPTKAFEQVVFKFAPKAIAFTPGIHPTAVVDPSAQIGKCVSIQPHAVIESGARIGDDTIIGAGSYIGHETVIGPGCLIYPRVTIRERSRIGSRVIIHSSE